MPSRCCEFVDSRLRRSPPDRASAVPMDKPGKTRCVSPTLPTGRRLLHKLHSTPQQHGMILISGNGEITSRLYAFSLFFPGSCPNNRDRRMSTIRDKAAFHYDKLNTERALSYLAAKEDMVYLAQQPINTVYYLGSSLVFRTLFTMISDNEDGVAVGSRRDRTKHGLNIAIRDASQANVNLHRVLYGLIEALLERAEGKPLHMFKQDRIDIKGAPDP